MFQFQRDENAGTAGRPGQLCGGDTSMVAVSAMPVVSIIKCTGRTGLSYQTQEETGGARGARRARDKGIEIESTPSPGK